MVFNSFNFLLFLPIVFALYFILAKSSSKSQNLLLLISSYFFYACWDYRFLFLLMFSTFLDYFTGKKMHEAASQNGKKILFWLGIGINLGFLGIFKYYNYFVSSFQDLLEGFGFQANFRQISIILPVGILFYAFMRFYYTIYSVYNNKIKFKKDIIDCFVLVVLFQYQLDRITVSDVILKYKQR